MHIVGYTPEVVMGKNLVKEFITKDHQASVGMVIDSALHGDETANFKFLLVTKEGVQTELLLNASAQCNYEGTIMDVVRRGQDIMGRIMQERDYTCLINTANAPIFYKDSHCTVRGTAPRRSWGRTLLQSS
jgi:PAS domain S-box-containing protein